MVGLQGPKSNIIMPFRALEYDELNSRKMIQTWLAIEASAISSK
jgi:hypothetical protein